MKPSRSGLVTGTATLAAVLGGDACKKPSTAEPAGQLQVAAAADLAVAFREIGELYQHETGQKVVFSFGSTGLLARQIEQGAPFDLFAAANVSFVDEVVAHGDCRSDTRMFYARGRLVLWTLPTASFAVATLDDLTDARIVKIAIANPEHAPYGRAAKAALIKAGIWDKVASKMVYGENVQQTLQFAQSGNADVAIVALSLALASGGHFVEVDDHLHPPLDQALVVCSHGANEKGARRFADLVRAPRGQAILTRNGFLLPGPSTAASIGSGASPHSADAAIAPGPP